MGKLTEMVLNEYGPKKNPRYKGQIRGKLIGSQSGNRIFANKKKVVDPVKAAQTKLKREETRQRNKDNANKVKEYERKEKEDKALKDAQDKVKKDAQDLKNKEEENALNIKKEQDYKKIVASNKKYDNEYNIAKSRRWEFERKEKKEKPELRTSGLLSTATRSLRF